MFLGALFSLFAHAAAADFNPEQQKSLEKIDKTEDPTARIAHIDAIFSRAASAAFEGAPNEFLEALVSRRKETCAKHEQSCLQASWVRFACASPAFERPEKVESWMKLSAMSSKTAAVIAVQVEQCTARNENPGWRLTGMLLGVSSANHWNEITSRIVSRMKVGLALAKPPEVLIREARSGMWLLSIPLAERKELAETLSGLLKKKESVSAEMHDQIVAWLMPAYMFYFNSPDTIVKLVEGIKERLTSMPADVVKPMADFYCIAIRLKQPDDECRALLERLRPILLSKHKDFYTFTEINMAFEKLDLSTAERILTENKIIPKLPVPVTTETEKWMLLPGAYFYRLKGDMAKAKIYQDAFLNALPGQVAVQNLFDWERSRILRLEKQLQQSTALLERAKSRILMNEGEESFISMLIDIELFKNYTLQKNHEKADKIEAKWTQRLKGRFHGPHFLAVFSVGRAALKGGKPPLPARADFADIRAIQAVYFP